MGTRLTQSYSFGELKMRKHLWALLAVALVFIAPAANAACTASGNTSGVDSSAIVANTYQMCSSGIPVNPAQAATDGSTTITLGSTAQNLFSGTTPTNGWSVINPDASEDCWASDTTTAAANNTGSIRIAANGGGYETPSGRKPLGAVSVVCATTGHKLTASKW